MYQVTYRRDTRWDVYPGEEPNEVRVVNASSEKEAIRQVANSLVAPPIIVDCVAV